MALLEWLFESAMGFAGIFGVFFLLLFLAAGILFVGTFTYCNKFLGLPFRKHPSLTRIHLHQSPYCRFRVVE
jgi:hypothetical protein